MKKTLTILWIIIIAGTIFIAIHFTKPTNIEEESTKIIENIKISRDTKDNTKTTDVVIEKTPAVILENSNKTFSEYLNLGDKHLSDNYLDNAIENYQGAYYLNNNSEEAITKLANAYLLNNQAEEAKQFLINANIELPESEEIIFYLVKSYINIHDFTAAQNLIWQLNENYEDNLKYKFYKALLLTIGKDYEGSKKLFSEIISTETESYNEFIENSQKFLDAYEDFSYYTEAEDIFLDLKLTKILTEIEEYHASIPLLYAILKDKNDYRDAWIVLGYVYLNTQQTLEAIDAFEQAEIINPNKDETLFFLGLSHYANDDVDNAIHYIEKAEKAGFEDQEQIDLRLGELYLIKENYEKSAQKYDNLLSSNQKNIKIYIRTVWLYIEKLNKADKALKIAEDAIEYHPEEAMSYNLLAWVYIAKNDTEKAKENLEIALEMNPYFDAANFNFGILYEKQGLALLAKEYYKNAYILGDGNSISQMAASNFNKLTEKEAQKYYQTNISQP